ncbi:MAG: MBL fold metallo-hydrolase [Myxococcota bacterium]
MRTLIVLILASVGCAPAGIDRPGLPTAKDGALHIVMFDVGQADATLIHYKGRAMLIDAGSGQYDRRMASRRIPPRLDAIVGDRRLDYFMISHYHQDHIGIPGGLRHNRIPAGIFGLVERGGVTIDTILDRGLFSLGEPPPVRGYFDAGVKRWMSIGAVQRRRILRPGDTIDMGDGLEVEVISVSGNGYLEKLRAEFPTMIENTPPSENDYSVGFIVRLGEFEFFSAGDLSGRSVLRKFGPNTQLYTDVESPMAELIGPVEVYRVNHHGSRYSTNPCFAQVLHPQVSVFSTGKNTYGHPDADVYDRLKGFGDVYITGGADKRIIDYVLDDVVRGDVEIVVTPEGERYWVNGKPYRSTTEATEQAREGYRARCESSDLVTEVVGSGDDQAG